MENEMRIVGDFFQKEDGTWGILESAKARDRAMYYRGRIAYDKSDPRRAIGTYNEVGEVVPFQSWVNETQSSEE